MHLAFKNETGGFGGSTNGGTFMFLPDLATRLLPTQKKRPQLLELTKEEAPREVGNSLGDNDSER